MIECQHTWQETDIETITAKELEPTQPTPQKQLGRTVRLPPEPPSVASRGTNLPRIDFKTLQEIQDMCSAIQQPLDSQKCLGFCLDSEGKLRGTYPLPSKVRKDTITLAKLLSYPSDQSYLSRKERLILGAILASSYLQLHATPWLGINWTKEDIVFEADVDNSILRLVYTIPPYMMHDFGQGVVTAPMDTQDGTSRKASGNVSLLTLGIIPMELYTGETLENYCTSRSISAPNNSSLDPVFNIYAAHQWLEDLKDKGHLSHAYVGAVHHCIQG